MFRRPCCLHPHGVPWYLFNRLTPNDPYIGRTAPLTSKRCILYIYSTNIGTEYFKHGIYSSFFPLQNAVCFIILTYLVPVLFTFCIQSVLKFKKIIIPAPKGYEPTRRHVPEDSNPQHVIEQIKSVCRGQFEGNPPGV